MKNMCDLFLGFSGINDDIPSKSSNYTSTATPPSSRPENVDLFAAGDRKPSPPSTLPIITSSSAKPIELSTFQKSGSVIELQAELLRLEAEKEQMLIDRAKLEEKKVPKHSFSANSFISHFISIAFF
jgi:hypothetical protein